MDTNFAYIESGMVQVVEYSWLYPGENVYPTITSLLENIPRPYIVNLAQMLVNSFNNANIEDMQKLFSSDSKQLKDDFNNRFERRRVKGVEYIFITSQTSLELLRYAFSADYYPLELEISEFEEKLLKVILLINEKLHIHNNIPKNENKITEASNLFLSNSFSQLGLNSEDYHQTFRSAFTKSIDFFEYAIDNNYFKPIYNRFISKLAIKSYREYITTIFGLFTIMKQNAEQSLKEEGYEKWMGDFTYIEEQIQYGLISKDVLDFLSIDIDKVIALKDNEDYRIFRGKPLIKKADGTYAVYNLIFLFERLFNSLYFDFRDIAEKELNLDKFREEYKVRFFEETLLRKYINRVNSNNRYFYLSGSESKAIKEEKAPDSYLKNLRTDSVILIEHKDIKINGEVKQSRDLELIISDFKNKLLLTEVSNGKTLEKPREKGIGQLVNSIEMIRNQTFVWDKDVIKDTKIYPVLVLTDSNIIPDGLPYLMKEWLYENLKEKNINSSNIRPLIVMEISTLLLYADEFRENGLEYYFEKYYESIENAKQYFIYDSLLSTSNINISFSIYMQKAFQKNHEKVFNEYIKKVI